MGTNFYLQRNRAIHPFPWKDILFDDGIIRDAKGDVVCVIGDAETRKLIVRTANADFESNRLHIGKSSCGWVFSLHVAKNAEEAKETGLPMDYDGWIALFNDPNNSIVDEYSSPVTMDAMIQSITKRPQHKQHPDQKSHMGESAYYDEVVGLWRSKREGYASRVPNEGATFDYAHGTFC